MANQPKECQFMCPGCSAEIVAQNFASNQELNPTQSGLILFMSLTGRGVIKRCLEDGATTHEEVEEAMGDSIWGKQHEPDELYGDLTKAQIVDAAIDCMLREARGECTLEEHHRQLASRSQ